MILETKKKPVAITAEINGDLSFIPFSKVDRKLNFSRFDTGGVTTQSDAPGLQTYLFSDRGIYRPGDTINLGIITKSDNWKTDISGVPLEITVTDPTGLEIRREKISFEKDGFQEFQHESKESSLTGKYTFSVYIVKDNKRGSLLGSTTVRIEEFLPDRMTIKTSFDSKLNNANSITNSLGWLETDDNLKVKVLLTNLFGTPATNRKISSELTVSSTTPYFKKYSEYTFKNPIKSESSASLSEYKESLTDSLTNDEGKAEFAPDLKKFSKSLYRLTFITKGFEAEGGRSVTSELSSLIIPSKFLIGYKSDGATSYISQNSEKMQKIIAINSLLENIEYKNAIFECSEIVSVPVLTKQENGTFSYQNIEKLVPQSSEQIDISKEGSLFKINTTRPGDFIVKIKSKEGEEINSFNYSVAGNINSQSNINQNGELDITLNKTEYKPGEEIEIAIRSPYTGAGLITIEKDKVYAFSWFKADSTSSLQKIKIPSDMTSGGYINVSFIRSIDSREIFISPLSYGVKPFTIARTPYMHSLKLEIPQKAKPGDTIKIGYSSEIKSKGVIYLADAGILQVAKYSVPKPVDYFFRKKALEVSTFQILDLILPEFSILKDLSATGGDQDLFSKHLNPFKRKRDKPVVWWSGIIEFKPETEFIEYTIPEYFNGTIKLFAVSVTPGKYCSRRKGNCCKSRPDSNSQCSSCCNSGR